MTEINVETLDEESRLAIYAWRRLVNARWEVELAGLPSSPEVVKAVAKAHYVICESVGVLCSHARDIASRHCGDKLGEDARFVNKDGETIAYVVMNERSNHD